MAGTSLVGGAVLGTYLVGGPEEPSVDATPSTSDAGFGNDLVFDTGRVLLDVAFGADTSSRNTGAPLAPSIVTEFISVPATIAIPPSTVDRTDVGLGVDTAVLYSPPPPPPPPGLAGTGRTVHPGIGTIVHEFTSGAGTVAIDKVDSWEATEDAPGGYTSASGQISDEWVRNHPDIFTFGCEWRAKIAETGEVRYGGRLLDPGLDGGYALLSSRGWGTLPEKKADRFLVQSRDYSQMQAMDGDPFQYKVANSIDVQTDGGRIRIKVSKGETTHENPNGVLFWASGIDLTRIAFTYTRTGTAQGFELAVVKGTGPHDDNLTVIQDGTNPYSLTGGSPDTRDVDLDMGANNDMVGIMVRNSTPTQPLDSTDTCTITITNLRINGLGQSDEYPAASFVREAFSRCGIRTMQIRGDQTNVAPYDLQDNSATADALDYVNLLTDSRHFIDDYGQGPVGRWGPWNEHIWQVPTHAQRSLVPLDRYNAVRVPFQLSGGQVDDVVVEADPRPFPGTNMFEELSLGNRNPDRSAALQLGKVVVNYLSQRRFGGSGTLSEVLSFDGSQVFSAHVVHAGDTLWYPEKGVFLRVASLRRTPTQIEVTFDERMAALDRLVSRQNQRWQQTGRY